MNSVALIFKPIYGYDDSLSGLIWDSTARCLDFGQQSYKIVFSAIN